MPLNVGPAHISDVTFFNARLAQMHGPSKDYRSALEQVVKQSRPDVWPVALAKQLLEQMNDAQPPAVLPPEDDSSDTP
jgi:hypothetical protein